jgi:ankyrin repeat protein
MFLKSLMCGLSVAILLPAAGVNVQLPDAVQRGDRAEVAKLLGEKADVNAAQGDGMTALHWAAFRDDVDVVRLLIQAGANVQAQTRLGGQTPLLMAAKNGDAAMINLLLYAGADAKSPDSLGTTPLMIAAASGNADAVKALLDHGAEINGKETAHGQTALMFAAALNRSAAAKVLLERGADPNILSKVIKLEAMRYDLDGNPLPPPKEEPPAAKSPAASKPQEPAAKAPASAEAGPAKTKPAEPATSSIAVTGANGKGPRKSLGANVMGGLTALLYAARDGQMEAVRTLVDGGADINEVSGSEKMSPLVMAISNGHFNIGKYLLDHGADPKIADVNGLTPLYAAIDVQWAPHNWVPMPSTEQESIKYLDLIKALLDRGADPNARLTSKLWFRTMFSDQTWVDAAGATPFWRAAVSTDVTAMRLLKAAGADPNIATTEGSTPLMVAAGLGWGANYSVTSADYSFLDAVKYCLELGSDINTKDSRGYTALHGVAFRGDNELIKFMVSKGAKTDAVAKGGETVADMANGPREHSEPYPETVALLESLGSKNSHNCRSAQCLVEPGAFKDRDRPTVPAASDTPAADGSAPAKAAPPATPAAKPNDQR